MTQLAVRPARPSDAAAIHDLRVELANWLAALGVKQWDPGEVGVHDVAGQVAAGEWHVATRGGQLVGALRLLWSDAAIWQDENAFAAYVHGLMVPRRHSGAGIGRALLSWAEDQARARQAPWLRLDCVESNSKLKEYYEALGFRVVGRRDFDGPWYSATLFEKPVAADAETGPTGHPGSPVKSAARRSPRRRYQSGTIR